jgi:ABC-type dipeptide/oligopeptide/nickel transport system permease subunit
MSVKEQQYITAARALGFSDFRIIFRHIIPNIMTPVIVISAANFAASILIESGLSFFGDWGTTPNVKLGCYDKGSLQRYYFRSTLFGFNSRIMYYVRSDGFYANRKFT